MTIDTVATAGGTAKNKKEIISYLLIPKGWNILCHSDRDKWEQPAGILFSFFAVSFEF